eukprot:Em0004g1088a
MDVVMRGLPFVTTYIDDVLIHSVHEELHKSHLEQAFQCLREAGLTLRGSKCQIGVAQLTYLGHTFSREGMSPDSSKARHGSKLVPAKDEAEVWRFRGLASYYHKYINKFADIAAPLHQLTQKDTSFQWTREAKSANDRSGPEIETRHAALTTVHAGFTAEEIRQAQQQDNTIQQLYSSLHSEQHFPHRNWKQPPLRRYAQLWSQLDTVDGIVCRKYQPGPTSDTIVVPLLPETLHHKALVHLCMFVHTTESMLICVPSFLYMYRVSKD